MSVAEAVVFRRAVDTDAGEVMTLQRAAFVTEAQLYGDPGVAPLVETLADIRSAIASVIVITGHIGGRMVAAGRVTVSDRVGHIGRLVVAPDLQGRGIGRALLAAVESACADQVDAFALFTGERTAANLHLYRSAGYVDTHTEHLRNALTFVHMYKPKGVQP